MKLSRRILLKSAAAQALLLPALSAPAWAAQADILQNYLLCAKNAEGEYVAVKITEDGQIKQQFTLADRGHGHAKSPTGGLAIFARRPNNQLYLIDETGKMRLLYAPEDRHFFGHGVFSPDGKLLYTSENDFDNEDYEATGVIGIWDVKHGKKIGEFSSAGIGVHQIMLMADGETLVIANGGILTHPDHPRQKLNLADMQPNLAFVNRKNGQLISKVNLPAELHQLSIRHIDITTRGLAAIAMQYQGGLAEDVPLIATVGQTQPLKFVQAPQNLIKRHKQYVGSICFDKSGKFFAASSPRGNIVSFYTKTGQFLSLYAMNDVCAVAAAPAPYQFILASGMGEIDLYDLGQKTAISLHTQSAKTELYQWDNHMLAL
ncbi:MAG: DUF1513 domain-containing protein [Alphaproteobacteria bacterium]|nr:DUF1513 domain-containing protein [Alphaproteobacteria bacterium]